MPYPTVVRTVEARFVDYPEGVTVSQLAEHPNMPSKNTIRKVLNIYVKANMADKIGSKYIPHKEILGRIRGPTINQIGVGSDGALY